MKRYWIALLVPVLVAGCNAANDSNVVAENAVANEPAILTNEAVAEPGNVVDATFTWPSTLRVVGDGYPDAGDVCRRIGETAATVDYLDDSATLVGCPGDVSSAAAQALIQTGGSVMGAHAGVTLISVPNKAQGAAGA